MTSLYSYRSRLFVVIAGAALAAGCSKASKDASHGKKGASPAAKAAFQYLPKDSASLIGMGALLKSGVVSDLVKGRAAQMLPPEFKAIKDKCGVDLLSDVSSAVVAIGADRKDKTKQFAVITGKFNRKQINDCANKSEIDGKKLSAKDDGKLTAYSRAGEDTTFYAYWPDDHTLVASAAPNNKAPLQAVMHPKQNVTSNAKVMALVADINTRATVWAVGDIQLKGISVDTPDASLLELYFDAGLKANLRLRYANSGAASKAKSSIEARVAKMKKSPFGGLVAPFLENLSLGTSGNDAVIKLQLDEKKLKRLAGLTKSFGGMGR